MADKNYIIYVDTGGTFTDAVVVEPAGTFIVGKAPTTTERLEVGFLNAISNAAEKMGKGLNEVLANCSQIGYGTTEGTNMLVSGARGPKLGLLITRGMEDRLDKGRLRSAGLSKQQAMHMIDWDNPKPIIPRPLVKGVRERMDVLGKVVIPLQEDQARQAIAALLEQQVEGIAVCSSQLVDEERVYALVQINPRTDDPWCHQG